MCCNLMFLPLVPCSLEEMKEYILPTVSTFNSVRLKHVCVCVCVCVCAHAQVRACMCGGWGVVVVRVSL